jgi:hypothetical protein
MKMYFGGFKNSLVSSKKFEVIAEAAEELELCAGPD